jgi:hypothetical protein
MTWMCCSPDVLYSKELRDPDISLVSVTMNSMEIKLRNETLSPFKLPTLDDMTNDLNDLSLALHDVHALNKSPKQ